VAFQGWRVWRDLQAAQQRASDLERQLAVSRLDALRMQLHPHFLFNTFHTITALIGDDPSTARRMMVALGDLLRRTLQEPAAPLHSLVRELEIIDLYMGIQRMRLGDRVTLDYDLAPDVTTATVPHLLLQPLFENAVRHGAARMAGRCSIAFRAERHGQQLQLRLENDAPPTGSGAMRREPGLPPRQGVGLSNTLDRLRLHYGDGFTFRYAERPPGGVTIELSLPYRPAAAEARDVHPPAIAGVAG
jgi:LytS/YehU family sensor histidine kinase